MPDSTTIVSVANNAVDKVDEGLRYLAAQLGVATDYIWPILVQQSLVEGAVAAVWLVIGTLVAVFAGRQIVPRWKAAFDAKYADEDPYFAVAIATTFLALFGTIAVGCSLDMAITHLANPEFYALKRAAAVIEQVKP